MATQVAQVSDDKRRKGHRQPERELPRFEQDLRRAKNGALQVRFTLICEAEFTDEDCSVVGMPIEVDKHGAIKILLISSAREIWLLRSAILSAEVLP